MTQRNDRLRKHGELDEAAHRLSHEPMGAHYPHPHSDGHTHNDALRKPTIEGFREHTARIKLAPGLSLDAAIDEINSHGRILYLGEAKPLDVDALATALKAWMEMRLGLGSLDDEHGAAKAVATEYARLVSQPAEDE